MNDTENHVNEYVNEYAEYAVWSEDLPEDRSHPRIFRCEDHSEAAYHWFFSQCCRRSGLNGFSIPKKRIEVKVQKTIELFPQEDPQIRHLIIFSYNFNGSSHNVLAVEEEWVQYFHTDSEEKAGRAVIEKSNENNQGTAQENRI